MVFFNECGNYIHVAIKVYSTANNLFSSVVQLRQI